MIATSIEQSKRLLEFGLNPESADMCYPPYYLGDENGDHLYYTKPKNAKKVELSYGKINPDEYIPAWSLSALLELMPYFTLDKNNPKYYKEVEHPYNCFNDQHGEMDYSTPIDDAYNMMMWFLENNYDVQKSEKYIKSPTEMNKTSKIYGWISKDPNDNCVHLSFNEPEFDGTYWNDVKGPGIMYAIDEDLFPDVKTDKPVLVELIIKEA